MADIEIIGVKRESEVTIRPGKTGNVIEWTEEYIVQTSYVVDDKVFVIANAVTTAATDTYMPWGGLPIPQNTVSTNGFATCQSLIGRRLDENTKIWMFSATWSSQVNEQDTQSVDVSDPTTVTPVRKQMFEVVKKARMRDYTGRPFVNGAGSMYSTALEVEEEIGVWEFTQFEPVHDGGGGVVTLTQPTVVATLGGFGPLKVRPPGVYNDNSYNLLIGVTDDTIHYFNGAINSHTFRYKAPYTLKLFVKDSSITRMYGVRCRITEYAIKYDPTRWLEKTMNVGPYFLAPRLNASGNPQGDYVKYEYIYYTKDVEDQDTVLSQDENGALGLYNLTLTDTKNHLIIYNNRAAAEADADGGSVKELKFDSSISASTTPFAFIRDFNIADGKPLADYQLVTGANGKKTYRAKRPDPATKYWNYIEYMNSFVFDFGDYLRVL